MSFPDYETKSSAQLRHERREGALFVFLIYLYVIGVGPALRLIYAALARVGGAA